MKVLEGSFSSFLVLSEDLS